MSKILLNSFFPSALFTIIYLVLISDFDSKMFLHDDNVTQWLPVINEAFEVFLRGQLPTINPYQLLGVSIIDVGYYSILNPFMLISYLLSFILVNFETITIYCCLMILLGNFFVFKLSREVGLSSSLCSLIVVLFTVISPYMYFGHWYYVFNNYFIIPFMLYILVKLTKKIYSYRSLFFYMPSFILSLSVYMGNIQYSVYHFIIFLVLIISVITFNPEKKYYIKLLLTNTFLSLLIILPQLILLKSVSEQSFDFTSGPNKEFFTLFVNPLYATLSLFVPSTILNNFIIVVPNAGEFLGVRRFLIGPLIWLSICYFIITIVEYIKKTSSTYNNLSINTSIKIITDASLILAVFFLTVMLGKESLTAKLLHSIPFLNSFRYLFKFIFLIPPLLLLPTIMFFKRIQGYRKKMIITVFFVLLGIIMCVNNAKFSFNEVYINGYPDIHSNLKNSEFNIIKKELIDNKIDIENYRITSVLNTDNFSSSFHLFEQFSRNGPTFLHVYSPGGYHLAVNKLNYNLVAPIFGHNFGFNMYNGIMDNSPFFTVTSVLNKTSDNNLVISNEELPVGVKHSLKSTDNSILFNSEDSDEVKRKKLEDRSFLFIRNDQDIISDQFILKKDGSIMGYDNFSEGYWDVQNGQVIIFSKSYMFVTSRQAIDSLLIKNSIRYIIIPPDSNKIEEVIKKVNISKNISVSRIIELKNKYKILEINGVKKLAGNNFGTPQKWRSSFAGYELTKETDTVEKFNLQFAYNSQYSCIFYPINGSKQKCDIINKNGYMEIDIPFKTYGTVRIQYININIILSIISICIICIFFMAAIFKLGKHFLKQLNGHFK